MPLSEKAIQHDKECGARLIPVKEIYADSEFNCRGSITATSIIELVADVAVRGLLLPIIVRPVWDNEKELIKKGFNWSLVAGFRRYSAYKANEAELIPTTVQNIQSDFECHTVNAIENLQRQDLTLWQEAKSIKHYWLADWSRQEVARQVSKSDGWVQVRYMLLGMPEEIQRAADQGYIIQSDIRELYKYEGAEQLRMAGVVRDIRKKGLIRDVTKHIKKKDKLEAMKVRSRKDVENMMEHIRLSLKTIDREQMIPVSSIISKQGNMFFHRALAWATGTISTLDLYQDIQTFLRSFGADYEIPNEQV